MEQNVITINQLIAQMLDEMKRVGYSDTTIWRYYQPSLGQFRKYFIQLGQTYYSPDVTDEYISLNKDRYERGEISYQLYRRKLHIGHRINEFFLTGELRQVSKKRGTSFIISESNEHLVDLFLDSTDYGVKARCDAGCIVRKYLCYFEEHGHVSLADVTHDEVREFILKTASSVKLSGLHNVLLYLKHFHIFLKNSNTPAPDCEDLFSYKVYREMPIQSYVTDEELKRILAVVETDTEKGKRNRAIILLGATTGMRAIDIIRMKLTDIDWRKGEIKFVQSKTDRTAYAPLVKETGEAIQDYILNARPKESGRDEVFLRVFPPKTQIQSATCIGYMFRFYQDKAGIRRQPFDGKGFHGLRRRLAKKLLVSGSPLTTVSQILGHSDLEAARQYLSLNTDDLAECAIDFNVIPLERKCLL